MSLLHVLKTVDRLGRPLRELRVSVTDRCNFRCTYCMPRDAFGKDHVFLPRAQILSFEEIERTVRICAELGVQKVRLTGGEPLLRAQLPKLVRMLAALPGVEVALTTNGSLLGKLAQPLAAAGLSRVTVSLDALDPLLFAQMSDTRVPVSEVLAGIEAARAAGITPIKVNAVVQRGVNESAVLPLARHFKGTGITVRFIEFMDVGTTNGWQTDAVVPAHELVRRIDAELPLTAAAPRYPGEVAQRYHYRDGSGEIGVIASVTAPFCGSCTRARLSADGHLYTCLFATHGVDLRPTLRAADDHGEVDAKLRERIERTWGARDDRYSELRHEHSAAAKIEMSYIGG
jgi:cyclic pyranopterin phosphate synthase